MSAKNAELEAGEEMSRCASCGVPENDDIKLKKCTACHLVQYCGVKCQKEHRPRHKRACKKRAAELRDELLFKQPESTNYGDCPICSIPMPLDINKHAMMPCCSKIICYGCNYANKKRQIDERLERTCLFCRHPTPETQEANVRILMKRIEANDPVALRQLGSLRRYEGDYKGAIEYWEKAVEFGDVIAHYQLSVMYNEGKGVEKDEKKEIYHLERATIGGCPYASYNLGVLEWNNGQYERGIRHCIIAANFGHNDAMQQIKEGYKGGFISKEDFAAALRAHKAAVDAMKSPQREAAEAARTMS